MLSKSQYIRGLKCHKSLWLHKNKPELRSTSTSDVQAIFDIGHEVGDCAKKLFPGGVEVKFDEGDFNGMAARTLELIGQGVNTIYEATFIDKGVFVMVDILHKGTTGWEIYEVKSSTSLKPHYVDDTAVQWFTLDSSLDVVKASVVYINKQYIRDGEIDVQALFKIDNVTEQVKELQTKTADEIDILERMVKSSVPNINIGTYCTKPNECDFIEFCWKNIPDVSVFNLYRMSAKKKFELYEKKIIELVELPVDYPLSKKQEIQVSCSKSDSIYVDNKIIESFIDKVTLPISFFDFETFKDAIPRFNCQRPYMQMPFQYSLHVLDKKGVLTHQEYLGDGLEDPREKLCERMLEDIPVQGSIVAFNMGFEVARIKELARDFPEYSKDLLALTERFVDLIEPFRAGGYYDPKFNGSFSIKSILPAMFEGDNELDYKSLNIQHGGMAMDTYAKLRKFSSEERKKIRVDLLAYCHLDTFAMVRIWEKLIDINDQ